MPNLLKMAKVQSILSLHAQGRSQREIARLLGVDRGTVRKYLLVGLAGSKPANAPSGSSPSKPTAPGPPPEPAHAPAGEPALSGLSKPAIAPTGSRGPLSKCVPYRAAIQAKAAERNEAHLARWVLKEVYLKAKGVARRVAARFSQRQRERIISKQFHGVLEHYVLRHVSFRQRCLND
jgi:hypothetical protein